MNKIKRNLLIFTVATLGIGWLGIALDRAAEIQNPQEGLGILFWLVTPLAVGLGLRAFGSDGWKDFGIRPRFRSAWMWYLLALLIVPLVTAILLACGVLVGAVSLPGFAENGLGGFLALMALGLGPIMFKNVFEEFAWRGYLTPRFDALGIRPLLNHGLTGVIWWGWHVTYWLYFLNRAEFASHTTLDVNTFMLVALFELPLYALAYGELRLVSGSVWPVWVLHTIANAFSLALLSGYVALDGVLGIVFSPGTEGILSAILFGALGLALYRYRMSKSAQIAHESSAARLNSQLSSPQV